MTTNAPRLRGSAAASFQAVLSNATLRQLELSWLISNAALWGWSVTLAAVAFERADVFAVGATVAFRQIPGALSAPLLGVFARPTWGLHVLLCIALLRAVAMAAGAAILAADAPFALIYVVIALEGLASGPMITQQQQLLPRLARSAEELAAANGVTEMFRTAGLLLGPAIATLGLALLAPSLVVVGFAVALLAAAALLVPTLGRLGASDGAAPDDPRAQLVAGLRESLLLADARLLVLLRSLGGFITGALQVFGTALAMGILALGTSGPPLLFSLIGLGGLLGGFVSLTLVGRRNLAGPMGLGLWGMGLVSIALGALPHLALVVPLLVLGGTALAYYMVAGTTLLYRTVTLDRQAAVFGVNFLLQFLGMAAGGMLGSVLSNALGVRPALLVTGTGLIAIAVIFRSRLQEIAGSAALHEREIAVARRSPIFGALPIGPLEQVAARLERVEVAQGATVMTQGEHGDDFYLVGRGRLQVLRDGRPVEELGEGDAVGEIALLRDVPRVATVRALTDCELWRLGRGEFLSAVEASPESFALASSLADQRLRAAGAPEIGRESGAS